MCLCAGQGPQSEYTTQLQMNSKTCIKFQHFYYHSPWTFFLSQERDGFILFFEGRVC